MKSLCSLAYTSQFLVHSDLVARHFLIVLFKLTSQLLVYLNTLYTNGQFGIGISWENKMTHVKVPYIMHICMQKYCIQLIIIQSNVKICGFLCNGIPNHLHSTPHTSQTKSWFQFREHIWPLRANEGYLSLSLCTLITST